jgi:phosphohistidine phosphatase
MRVVLLRHGPAGHRDASRWPDDRLRPLSVRGIRRTRLAAAGLARLVPGIRTIVTSPLRRAAETADLLKDALDAARVETLDALAPGGGSDAIAEFLAGRSPEETLALVGHEPGLGEVAGLLLFGAPAPLALKKSGACAIEFSDGVTPGTGELAWFLPPRVLRRLAPKRVKA